MAALRDWRELAGDMAPAHIEEALDDDGDGVADARAWALVLGAASVRVATACPDADARHPEAADYARRMFCLESLFARRGFAGDGNPFSARALDAERRLRALASGDETTGGDGDAVFVGEPAKASGIGGLMA